MVANKTSPEKVVVDKQQMSFLMSGTVPEEADDARAAKMRKLREPRASEETVGSMIHKRQMARAAARQAALNRVPRSTHKLCEKHHKEHAAEDEAHFQQMLADIDKGRQDIVVRAQRYVDNAETAHQKKAKALHDEWDQAVFQKIQRRIMTAVSQRSSLDVAHRLQLQHQQYLDAVNRTRGIFRDTIIPAEYDPLQARQFAIRVGVADIEDPIKRDLLKDVKEKQMVLGDTAVMRYSKDTLSPTLWDRTGCTPATRCINDDGEYVPRALSPESAARRASHVKLDMVDMAIGKEAVLAEYPICKHIVPQKMG